MPENDEFETRLAVNKETPESVIQFWFGDAIDNLQISKQKSDLWWSKNDQTDERIKKRFGGLVEDVFHDRLDDWLDSPSGLLAAILSQDQFPRNIYRNSGKSFACDEKARELAKLMLKREWQFQLLEVQRVFVYLPYEHSESLEDQMLSLRLYDALRSQVAESEREMFDGYYQFAIKHYDIVAQFGRFPHRNKALGRYSSNKETAFLRQPGSSF